LALQIKELEGGEKRGESREIEAEGEAGDVEASKSCRNGSGRGSGKVSVIE
jgi:hypothetical protein